MADINPIGFKTAREQQEMVVDWSANFHHFLKNGRSNLLKLNLCQEEGCDASAEFLQLDVKWNQIKKGHQNRRRNITHQKVLFDFFEMVTDTALITKQ